MNLINAYRKYIEYKDYESERFLIFELYKNIQFWIQNGYPDNTFLMEFLEISFEHEMEYYYNLNLLELGLSELIEAVNYYQGLDKNIELINHFLKQALMPLLAWIEPESYRKIKDFHFSEIDFRIFDIIGGEFPHESAQFFLKTSNYIEDIWGVIKYFEKLDDHDVILEILESLLINLKVLPEKYVLIAYLLFKFPEMVRSFFYNKYNKKFIKLPKEIQYLEFESAFLSAEEFLFKGQLRVDFYKKILNPRHETIVLFVLLSLFEITNPVITPSWIEVFERGISHLWTYKSKTIPLQKKHQPIPEFVANIIAFLDENIQREILSHSKILILFFENLYRYTKQTFDELLDLITIQSDVFEEELIFQLQKNYIKSRSEFRRWESCANSINKKIIKDGSIYILKELEEL